MKNRSIKPNKKRFQQKEEKVTPLSEMSQQELIRLGYRKPYYVKPDFSKTAEERERLKKVHKSGKGPTSGSPVRRGFEPVSNLIVHVKPNGDKDYKSTYCFKAKASEVDQILYIYLGSHQVTKGWFQGKPLQLKAA